MMTTWLVLLQPLVALPCRIHSMRSSSQRLPITSQWLACHSWCPRQQKHQLACSPDQTSTSSRSWRSSRLQQRV
ncbi:hypothetical protein F751_0206 [Auxenochlorella protothecoides]|uniref:Secreted protein n=1 Tax=Auxenochlorella protothecoides TaxID=3075 RepID=A0A087S9Y3_AUXPR|nr:hypothetical protein F751_0206 [Auxenochlorella protothecoides]KFM22537.1 hypothetical protein F751_0206 [Auxenochlorella protothecoides]